jgi:hypothetical protein
VVIKVFFTVLVLCTVAVVAVILAIHFRVKRHLQQPATNPSTEVVAPEEPIAAQVHLGNGGDAVEEKRP